LTTDKIILDGHSKLLAILHPCRFTRIAVSTTIHTHTHLTALFGTTRVSRYQKGKTNLDFTEARDSEWQWHQLGHMQVCTSLQTDNHASTPPLSFLQARCPSCHPTNSVKALKALLVQQYYQLIPFPRYSARCQSKNVNFFLLITTASKAGPVKAVKRNLSQKNPNQTSTLLAELTVVSSVKLISNSSKFSIVLHI